MSKDMYELKRTKSICPTPESLLLEYVRNNQTQKIKDVVEEHTGVLNSIYDHPFNKPILQIACSEFAQRVSSQTLQTLIDLGADLYYCDEMYNNKEALHFAAASANPDTLNTIVKNLKPEKIDSLSEGNTALHVLIKEADEDSAEVSQCAKILIESGIDVNKADDKNLSPIFWGAKKGYKRLVKSILQTSKTVDLDTYKLRGKTARDLILEKNLYDKDLPHQLLKYNLKTDTIKEMLFGHLKENNENDFIKFQFLSNFLDIDDGENTLLQLASEKGLVKVAKLLLEKGANPNKTTESNLRTPTEIAAIRGYHQILECLFHDDRTEVPSHILTDLLKHIDGDSGNNMINHKLCYEMYVKLKDQALDLNAKDPANKNSPLHYAIRYGSPDQTLYLLQLGASLASKNKFGALPIEDIDAITLEKHLNECIKATPENKIEQQNFTITYDYKTLLPPKVVNEKELKKKEVVVSGDIEASKELIRNEIQELVAETEVISYISKSPELRHLLKHPVVTSFLYMKWHRIRWFFYTNLAFYITFCMSLIIYIFLIYNNRSYKKDEENFVKSHRTISFFIFGLVCVTFIILLCRELFQMAVSPKKYFFIFENWIELVLIGVTGLIVFQNSPTIDTKKQLSAIAILLSAFELVLLIGQHPRMSTNVVMLRTVSLNFFKFLMWYSILIIAFALSFYTLFKESVDTKDDEEKNEKENEEQDFFVNPATSLFKTIVMLTGEFDASSINFQTVPLTSYIIFTLFIVMIAIILFNLLNGLAVSDTQMIKSDAELVGHQTRIEHISYVESMLLGNILPISILSILHKTCCCLPTSIVQSFTVSSPLAERVCLFPHFLKEYELKIYPNQEGKVVLPTDENHIDNSTNESCVRNCRRIYLDKKTIKQTKYLIKERREKKEKEKGACDITEKQDEIIKKHKEWIQELKDEQRLILQKIDILLNKL